MARLYSDNLGAGGGHSAGDAGHWASLKAAFVDWRTYVSEPLNVLYTLRTRLMNAGVHPSVHPVHGCSYYHLLYPYAGWFFGVLWRYDPIYDRSDL